MFDVEIVQFKTKSHFSTPAYLINPKSCAIVRRRQRTKWAGQEAGSNFSASSLTSPPLCWCAPGMVNSSPSILMATSNVKEPTSSPHDNRSGDCIPLAKVSPRCLDGGVKRKPSPARRGSDELSESWPRESPTTGHAAPPPLVRTCLVSTNLFEFVKL